jgi:hypothetical protein
MLDRHLSCHLVEAALAGLPNPIFARILNAQDGGYSFGYSNLTPPSTIPSRAVCDEDVR